MPGLAIYAPWVRPGILLITFGFLAANLPAQMMVAASAPALELKQLSLEQLMDIEVTSVSRQPEKLLDAAAAIQVVTGDDIRRSGATSLPEALRLADNLNVAQINSHDWAISARGFNANLANKLLVLIDGRAVYTPLYGGVLWNVQDTMLADVDRIEVISGPGGTLWGANAVNGVINVTTRSARSTQGLLVEGGGGSALQDFAGVRYGGTLAPNVFFRIYGNYFNRDGEVYGDGSEVGDDWHMVRGGFRIDSEASSQNTLTLQGDIYSGDEDVPGIGTEDLSGGNILGRWSHSLANDSELSLQLYYDHTHLSQPYAAVPGGPFSTPFPASALVDDLDTYDVDFQHSIQLEGHKLVWGLGYRFTHEVDTNQGIVRFSPPELDQHLFSAFVQDEIVLRDNWQLTVGTKVEHFDYTGFEVEPSVRVKWNPAAKHMLWASISRAVRTPARFDRDLNVVTGLVNAPPPLVFPTDFLDGSDDFVSEVLVAYEAGYRAQLGPRTTAALSLFYNDYSDVRSTAATPTTPTYPVPFPVVFGNNLEAQTHGFEFTLDYQIFEWWRVHAGYTLLRENIHAKPGFVDATGATNETADPEQQWSLRSAMNLPQNFELGVALRWVDSLTINQSPTSGPVTGTVPSYSELDARIAWHPSRSLELALVGQNLLHDHHVEYGFPSATRVEIQRRVYAKATWRY